MTTVTFRFTPGDRVILDGTTIGVVTTVGIDESGIKLCWVTVGGVQQCCRAESVLQPADPPEGPPTGEG